MELVLLCGSTLKWLQIAEKKGTSLRSVFRPSEIEQLRIKRSWNENVSLEEEWRPIFLLWRPCPHMNCWIYQAHDITWSLPGHKVVSLRLSYGLWLSFAGLVALLGSNFSSPCHTYFRKHSQSLVPIVGFFFTSPALHNFFLKSFMRSQVRSNHLDKRSVAAPISISTSLDVKIVPWDHFSLLRSLVNLPFGLLVLSFVSVVKIHLLVGIMRKTELWDCSRKARVCIAMIKEEDVKKQKIVAAWYGDIFDLCSPCWLTNDCQLINWHRTPLSLVTLLLRFDQGSSDSGN